MKVASPLFGKRNFLSFKISSRNVEVEVERVKNVKNVKYLKGKGSQNILQSSVTKNENKKCVG